MHNESSSKDLTLTNAAESYWCHPVHLKSTKNRSSPRHSQPNPKPVRSLWASKSSSSEQPPSQSPVTAISSYLIAVASNSWANVHYHQISSNKIQEYHRPLHPHSILLGVTMRYADHCPSSPSQLTLHSMRSSDQLPTNSPKH
ncbi:hypothetical protein PM082_007961 [Marasmius tenuissimus]|nr:hypothetical protein PM082_007961 [Marasmius tenuissimus]